MTATSFAEATALPLELREQLCRDLLAEFGVTGIHERRVDHELNHRCPLPWHQEKTPSASLNYDKLTFCCLGCQSKGGLLWFIASCRGETTRQSRAWLLKETGSGPDFDLSAVVRIIEAIANQKAERKTPIPQMSMRVLDPWRLVHPYLTDPPPDGRGISFQNVVDAQVGYAERYPLGRDEANQQRYGQRVVIPMIWRGHLVGWQSRRLYDDGTPKYLSSPDFPKDRTIYNQDPHRHTAVVVESAMSVLRHRHHLPMESTWGASVTDNQVRLIARHERVILWMDNDPAGWNATAGHWREVPGRRAKEWVPGLIEKLTPYCEVRVVDSPWAADPADLDDATAEGLVAAAVPGAVWKRPVRLLCWLCKGEHEGRCP